MTGYEWKKLLLGRRGWLVILALLIAELVGVLFFTEPYDTALEDHRQVYESYLTRVEGPLTEEKRNYLEAEMEHLNTVHQELERLKADYYTGDVTEEEYRENFDRLAAEDANYFGFSRLYSQYIFVRESPQRSFLYTGGWELLLTDQQPDYLFLLALIILLSPIFCEEYACGMHEILLTQKRSAKYQVLSKVTVALTLTFGLTMVLQVFDLVCCALRFGLRDGSFALQSLYSFGNTAKQLTLWQAFWLQFALKVLGYWYCALLILCLSVGLKKFALTLMAGIAILPLLFLTVAGANSFLTIPGPWALTLGSIYLNGGSEELSGKEICILILASVAIMGILLAIIQRKNTNWQLRRFLAVAVLCLFVLTGCSESRETVVYNRSESGRYETEDFLLVTGYDGATLTDKAQEKTLDFPLDPLEGEIVTCGSSFYGVGNTVYYLKFTTHHPDAGSDVITLDCDLMKLELDTMEETVVHPWNTADDWFFGLLDRESWEPDIFSVELLFIHGNEMYYTDNSEYGLYKMNLLTGEYEVVLPSLNSQDIAYDGTSLYYLDSYNRLVIRNLETGAEQVVDEVVARDFWLTGEGIRFENRREASDLYFWSPSDRKPRKISDS